MTFDEARLMANVNARAQRLFEDGYRARWLSGSMLSVRSPGNAVYRLDVGAETCNCPFFQKYCCSQKHSTSQKQSGYRYKHYRCKHLLGYRRLLSRQRMGRLLVALILLRVWTELDDTPNSQEPQHSTIARTNSSEEKEVVEEKEAQATGAEETEATDVAF